MPGVSLQRADYLHAHYYMVALTDSDDDVPTENLDRLSERARDMGDETVQVLKQALEHYRDIQSHVGAGIMRYD